MPRAFGAYRRASENASCAPRRFGGTSALTPSERAVIELVARGLPNTEVALLRGVSTSTISNQLTTAYRKLRVGGRRELRAASDPSSAESLAHPDQWRGLSPREQQVLALVERGLANKVIAPTVGVGVSTVSTLLTRARRKLASSAPTPLVTAQEPGDDQQENGSV